MRPAKLIISDLEGCLTAWEEAFAEQRDSHVTASLASIFPSLHDAPAMRRVGQDLAVSLKA